MTHTATSDTAASALQRGPSHPWQLSAAHTAAVVLLTLLSGCASLIPAQIRSAGKGGVAVAGVGKASATPAARPASGPPAAVSAAAPVVPGSPQPFATVIRDAKKTDGLFMLYQKDEKVWIELKPGDFDKPFFLSPKVTSGIGESSLYGGLYDTAQVIQFRRIHNQVQMIALNTRFIAKPGSPEARAIAQAFSPSLLSSAPVVSQPHPEAKSVLVELNGLFLNDMLAVGTDLQRTYRQSYGFDMRNSAITRLRGTAGQVSLEVLAHYATGSIAVPQPGSLPGAPVPTVPRSLPDARSLFMTIQYAIAKLPDETMAARKPDPRIGYFTSHQADFGDDLARSPSLRHINRWRLEKKEPGAVLSEPVKPLVYWLDRTIPVKYRDSISAGILEWNKAFERIGFKGAIEVKVQPDDADFDTFDLGSGVGSVRWMTNSSPTFGAIGLTQVDPRSGEILGANIAIESLSSRSQRTLRAQVLTPNAIDWRALMQAPMAPGDAPRDPYHCEFADFTAGQLSYGLDVLSARGDIDPAGPEAQQFVLDYLRDTAMHEVGHTLGLRHNFRASRIYSDAQLSDPDFTRSHALSGSVMEYAPINLAAPGAARVTPFQTTLGPYDYWAIEYAYKPIAPADEKSELARIAARSTEPELAYGTDEDNYIGIDPDALQFDLGNDAIAFAKKRIAIARELFKRQETRALPSDQDYAVLRRSLNYAVLDVAKSVGVLSRQIGGVRTLRDFPGSGRDPLQPVSVALQRDAIDVLSSGLLAADSWVISPELQRRLAPDFLERADALAVGVDSSAVGTEFSLTQRVFGLQRSLLNQLMSDALASRIIDSQGMIDKRADAFQLSDLYSRLERDIWSELDVASDIPAPRRELQREYLNRVAATLLRPAVASRADTRSLVRARAQTLLVRLESAARRGKLSPDVQAHLQDCADTLAQALSAKVQRVGL